MSYLILIYIKKKTREITKNIKMITFKYENKNFKLNY